MMFADVAPNMFVFSIDEWCKMWYNVTRCGEIIETMPYLIESLNAPTLVRERFPCFKSNSSEVPVWRKKN